MSHILLLEWNSFANEHMKRAWQRAGDTFDCFDFDCHDKNTRYDAGLTTGIAKALLAKHYDYLFSFNYFPVAAMAAKACKVRYVAWVYDSPYAQLYSETVRYETNDIRLFDSMQVMQLKALGVETVSYLPLAADADYYDSLRGKAGEKYESQVAFVGSLYTEPKQQLYQRFTQLNAYDKGFLDALVGMQKQLYGKNMLEMMLEQNPQLLEHLQQTAPLPPHPDGFETPQWSYANYYLYRRVTALERSEALEMLAKSFQLNVYTHAGEQVETQALRDAIRPPLDYYTQAPLVYRHAKININITLKSIESGIPLRAFDIMGAGGFLLTNYQADMLELFEPDRDFVYYTDMQDMMQKVEYYLQHEEERKCIAQNGYEKVKKQHTYLKRLQEFRA